MSAMPLALGQRCRTCMRCGEAAVSAPHAGVWGDEELTAYLCLLSHIVHVICHDDSTPRQLNTTSPQPTTGSLEQHYAMGRLLFAYSFLCRSEGRGGG